MEKHKKFFDAAFAVALAAPGVGGRHYRSFRLGCVIVEQKRIVSARFNTLKTSPKLLRYFEWPFLHAEANAIFHRGFFNCSGSKLYVVRVLRNNTLAMAKPCSGCMKLIIDVGIKEVLFSTGEGFLSIKL